MATFAGMVHEYLEPTPILSAELEADRLTLRYGTWVFDATSRDGFHYEGNYGERQIDPDRVVQCWVYAGPDGSKLVYAYWHHRAHARTQGESVFRLVPGARAPSSHEELPADWDRTRRALNAQPDIVPGGPPELLLAHDRWTGHRSNHAALAQPGLYVLFYGSGKIARVGQALRPLAQRLADYEPNSAGWFSYRWVAVVPIGAERTDVITPLEDYLLASLKPPENTRGVDRDSP